MSSPVAASAAPTTPPSRLTGMVPALGWNTWDAYNCDINETVVLDAAQKVVSLGLRDAGYQYVNIDDCWAEANRTDGKLVPNRSKFPNGLASVADTIHGLGLKIGVWSCAGNPGPEQTDGDHDAVGSLGYEAIDAQTWSSWGIDYLKYTNCDVPANWADVSPAPADLYDSNTAIRYRLMGDALASQSRPFHFNLCLWGDDDVWEWGPQVGHTWRIFGDYTSSWTRITQTIVQNAQYLNIVNFFSHNDMDFLEIASGNLTNEEQRTHFAAWAFMKSPIIISDKLEDLSPMQLAIMTNHELLAFNQDKSIGSAAVPFTPKGVAMTNLPNFYYGQSTNGTHVFVINTGDSLANMTFDFASVKGLSGTSFKVHDMWTSEDLGMLVDNYTVELASHDTAAFLLTPPPIKVKRHGLNARVIAGSVAGGACLLIFLALLLFCIRRRRRKELHENRYNDQILSDDFPPIRAQNENMPFMGGQGDTTHMTHSFSHQSSPHTSEVGTGIIQRTKRRFGAYRATKYEEPQLNSLRYSRPLDQNASSDTDTEEAPPPEYAQVVDAGTNEDILARNSHLPERTEQGRPSRLMSKEGNVTPST